MMNIVCSSLYETQLKSILEEFAKKSLKKTKNFKLYLDTIILNMPTKAKKYKKSIYFDNNDDIKDIEHEGFTIVFYTDNSNDTYLVLGIIKKNLS